MTNLLNYKGYYGTIEHSVEEALLYGKVIGINALLSYEGLTIEALKKDFENVLDDYLTECEQRGVKPEKAYKGSFNVRVDPELHRMAAIKAKSIGMSLNRLIELELRNSLKA
jgi:predicted HicB family RNase H-like nuclease